MCDDNFFLNAEPHHQLWYSGLFSLSVLMHVHWTLLLLCCKETQYVVQLWPQLQESLCKKSKQQCYWHDSEEITDSKNATGQEKRWVFAVLDNPYSDIFTFHPTASCCSDSFMYKNCLPCIDCPKLVFLNTAAVAADPNIPCMCAAPLVVLYQCALYLLPGCAMQSVSSICSVHLWLLQGNSLVYSCLYCWEWGLIAIKGSRYSCRSTPAGHPRLHYLVKPPADANPFMLTRWLHSDVPTAITVTGLASLMLGSKQHWATCWSLCSSKCKVKDNELFSLQDKTWDSSFGHRRLRGSSWAQRRGSARRHSKRFPLAPPRTPGRLPCPRAFGNLPCDLWLQQQGLCS